MLPGETGTKKSQMGPWISPTSSQLHAGWPWGYVVLEIHGLGGKDQAQSGQRESSAEEREES